MRGQGPGGVLALAPPPLASGHSLCLALFLTSLRSSLSEPHPTPWLSWGWPGMSSFLPLYSETLCILQSSQMPPPGSPPPFPQACLGLISRAWCGVGWVRWWAGFSPEHSCGPPPPPCPLRPLATHPAQCPLGPHSGQLLCPKLLIKLPREQGRGAPQGLPFTRPRDLTHPCLRLRQLWSECCR